MSIEDRLQYEVTTWVAENPGDILAGTIVGISELEGDYGPYPYVEVMKKDGSVWGWHAFDTIPKNELAKQRAAVGDELGAKFEGMKPTKPGSKYKEYKGWRVIVEKASGPVDEPDWDAMKDATDDEVADVRGDVVDGAGEPF